MKAFLVSKNFEDSCWETSGWNLAAERESPALAGNNALEVSRNSIAKALKSCGASLTMERYSKMCTAIPLPMAMTPVHCSRRVSFFAGAIDCLVEGSVVWRRSINWFADRSTTSEGVMNSSKSIKSRSQESKSRTRSRNHYQQLQGALQVVRRDNGLLT